MTKVIDNRDNKTTTFENLDVGDFYQDNQGNICIKTGPDRCIWYHQDYGYWVDSKEEGDEYIIPLDATVTVERKV